MEIVRKPKEKWEKENERRNRKIDLAKAVTKGKRDYQFAITPFYIWCLGSDLNRHGRGLPRDFKSIT